MKVTIERKEKVEVEVNLPLFTKDKYYYYMIEENRTTTVLYHKDEVIIQMVSYTMQFPCAYEQIDCEEFFNVLTLAKTKLPC